MTDLAPLTRSVVTARRLRMEGGEFFLEPAPLHRLVVHVSDPIVVSSRTEGQSLHRAIQQSGDADFIPAGVGAWWSDEGPAEVVAVRLSDSLFDEAAWRSGRSMKTIRLRPRLQIRGVRVGEIATILADVAPEARPTALAHGLGLALAGQILDVCGEELPARTRPLGRQRLRAVESLMQERLESGVSLDELAEHAGLSRSQFATAFRLAVGVSPHQHLIRLRVDQARELLLNSNLPVSEIALRCGFSHQSHLARLMRRLDGVTPSDLLRRREAQLLNKRIAA